MDINNLIKNNLSQIQEEYLELLKEIFGKYYFEYKNNSNYTFYLIILYNLFFHSQ